MLLSLCTAMVLMFIVPSVHAALEFETHTDSFDAGDPGLAWAGAHAIVNAPDEPRLAAQSHPTTGPAVMRVATDGSTGGVFLTLAGPARQDMTVEAWVFCDGNDVSPLRAGYQGIVARASDATTDHFIRLAWDPDHQEAGDAGDGWVKLQAHDGSSWDYLGLDYSQFGAATDGYILNGTAWPSGWHRFRLTVNGAAVAAFVDDMETPVAEGTLSLALRDGQGGFYVYSSVDFAGYFDDFLMETDYVTQTPTPTPTPIADFDIIIRGGSVIADGDSDPQPADVGIIGDRIAAVGDLAANSAHREIKADGLLVVPGFVDVHSHADGGGQLPQYLRQGVTTIVAGNCGGSPSVTNVGPYYNNLEGGLGPNYIGLIGHNSLRAAAGLTGSTPTQTQMNNMKTWLDNALAEGAAGLSTGLIYATGFNSTTEEVIELAKVAAARDALYTTHMRNEAETVLDAVAEALRIGREAGCRVQISHVKCAGPSAWGLPGSYLALVDTANSVTTTIMMDQYPYTASQTTINALIPDWAEANWADAKANHRAQLEADTAALIAGRGGADRVYLISGTYSGQWLHNVAANLAKSPENVVIDNIGLNGANAIYHTMQEDDVRAFMPHPLVMMGSDGPTGAHPRGQGTFPRLWGHYGRDLGMFTPRLCVMKTSTLASRQFRMAEHWRGSVRPGWFADITILDWSTVIDRATFDSPGLSPLGIPYVIINGQFAVDSGSATSARPGRVLRITEPSGVSSWMVH